MMEEKLKAMVDSLKKGLDSEVENDLKKSKEEEKQIDEERDKKIEAANKMIEEANKEAEEKKAEVHNKVLLKYENIFKEMNGGIVQQEQPLENFDIPNMEINKEEKQEISHDLENELFNQTKEDNYTDIVSNDSTNVVIENNDENKEEEQPEFTPVEEPQVSVDFETAADAPVGENEFQIETSEPIQVVDVEPYEKKEETKENTEVNDEVVNAAPGTDVFVGSLPAEFAQVANSQQEPVQETAPVEEVAQEQPISNVELSSGFTDIIDSMEQGRARELHPNK